MSHKILIIIPTYNEQGNILILFKKIKKIIKKNIKIIFIDDNSNDNTIPEIKEIIKKNKNIYLKIRSKKLGVGSAHKDGLIIAYKKKYSLAITLDADGTHNPEIIPKMINLSEKYDLIITNRFKNKFALRNWSWYRKFLTLTRFYLINILLNISLDTSGGYRCYNIKQIKLNDILEAKDPGYSFFWESTYLLFKKKYNIKEIPISLPFRKIGISKMKFKDIFYAFFYLIFFSIRRFFK